MQVNLRLKMSFKPNRKALLQLFKINKYEMHMIYNATWGGGGRERTPGHHNPT